MDNLNITFKLLINILLIGYAFLAQGYVFWWARIYRMAFKQTIDNVSENKRNGDPYTIATHDSVISEMQRISRLILISISSIVSLLIAIVIK